MSYEDIITVYSKPLVFGYLLTYYGKEVTANSQQAMSPNKCVTLNNVVLKRGSQSVNLLIYIRFRENHSCMYLTFTSGEFSNVRLAFGFHIATFLSNKDIPTEKATRKYGLIP